MRLNSLRALIAAVEEGSLRAAARRIGCSQPALTKMVRELERDVSAPLLMRSTTGVLATAQGRVMYEQARKVERELAHAVSEIGQLSGHMVGELAISAVPLVVLQLVPETLRTFGREFPQISLRIREELYVAQLTDLRKGEVDIVVGPIPEGLPPGEFHVEPLMPVSMAVVAGKGSVHARAQSLHDLADARWVYTSVAGATGYARLLFERNGLQPPPPAAVVDSTLGLLSLVGTGEFVGLMPLPIARHPAAAPFMTVLPVREGCLDLTVGAIVLADSVLKPVVRHFLSHLHRAAHHATASAP